MLDDKDTSGLAVSLIFVGGIAGGFALANSDLPTIVVALWWFFGPFLAFIGFWISDGLDL